MAVPAAARLLPACPAFVPAFVGVSLLLLASPRAAMAQACPVTMSTCATTDWGNVASGNLLQSGSQLSFQLCQTYAVLSGYPVWGTYGPVCYVYVCRVEGADIGGGYTTGNAYRCSRFTGCSIPATRPPKCPGLSKAAPAINGHYQCCCPSSAKYPTVATFAGRGIFTGCVPNSAVWV